MELEEIDIENIRQSTNILIKKEMELEKLTLKQIQFKIEIIEKFLERLQQQEIELYEEDLTGRKKEELQEVSSIIEKMSNYLDRLYDFESFAE